MIWFSNKKWGSKLRQKQAPQNRSTPRLLPPTWASAAESPRAPAPGAGITPRFPFTAARTIQGCRTRSNRQTMAM